MSKHTPTPYRAGYEDEQRRRHTMIVRAEDVDGQPWVAICRSNFGDIPIEANAEFIVRACNSHDALYRAAVGVIMSIRADDAFEDVIPVPRPALLQLQAAIAGAEGGAA